MGWLELLPLLKRVLPLLTRVAPMLETFIAARGGARAESEAAWERVAVDVKGHLAATAKRHDSLADLLEVQAGQIASLGKNLEEMRTADEVASAHLLEIETSVAVLASGVRRVTYLLLFLLVLTAILVITLLLDRLL